MLNDSVTTFVRVVFGIALILLGIAGGIYVGVLVLLVGGIVQLIEGAKASPVDAHLIAYGIVKVLIASPAGYLTFLIPGALARWLLR